MFDITDKLKNYGLQQTNYNITTPLTKTYITKHMKWTGSGSGIDTINKNIIQEFANVFTISL